MRPVRFGVAYSLVLLAAMALAAASCSTGTPAGAGDELGPPRAAALPNVTPNLYVAPLIGPGQDWNLDERVAAQLHRYDIAASTLGHNGASYLLYSLAEGALAADGFVDVTIHWDLLDPEGELIGTVTQAERMAAADWQAVPATLDAVAEAAAARIVAIVPGRRWSPVDPAAVVAARAEREKIEEQRNQLIELEAHIEGLRQQVEAL